MNITLSPEQVKLIEAQLALGQFSSPEEVITKALQTLTQTRKHYWEWVEEVRSSVEEAEAELSRGEGILLETAIEQLQEKFRKAGKRLLREFVKKCENLVKFPNMGRSYDRIKSGLRGVPLDGYIIFYQVVENGIQILRVMSGYQDFEAMFPDEN